RVVPVLAPTESSQGNRVGCIVRTDRTLTIRAGVTDRRGRGSHGACTSERSPETATLLRRSRSADSPCHARLVGRVQSDPVQPAGHHVRRSGGYSRLCQLPTRFL